MSLSESERISALRKCH